MYAFPSYTIPREWTDRLCQRILRKKTWNTFINAFVLTKVLSVSKMLLETHQ